MPTYVIALASALLLAALVTETVSRFWPDSYLALLIVTAAALIINGLFNARLSQREPAAADTTQSRKEPGKNNNRNRQRQDNRRKEGKGANGKESRAAEKQKPKREPAKREDNAPRGPEETGEVKWFNRSKGYGFIIRENGDEIFVHQRSIVNTGGSRQRPVLQDGQKVKFVVAHLEKGAQAENVKPLD